MASFSLEPKAWTGDGADLKDSNMALVGSELRIFGPVAADFELEAISADDYDAMNEAYTSVFAKDPPARAAFAAAGIAMGAAAEFKCIATT